MDNLNYIKLFLQDMQKPVKLNKDNLTMELYIAQNILQLNPLRSHFSLNEYLLYTNIHRICFI